jgi:hypothetical protein
MFILPIITPWVQQLMDMTPALAKAAYGVGKLLGAIIGCGFDLECLKSL